MLQYIAHEKQGRRHGVEWAGHVHHTFAIGYSCENASLVSFYGGEGSGLVIFGA